MRLLSTTLSLYQLSPSLLERKHEGKIKVCFCCVFPLFRFLDQQTEALTQVSELGVDSSYTRSQEYKQSTSLKG